MRLVFFGTPAFALPTLEALIGAGHQVVRVYSQPPAPSGRGQNNRASPIAAFAHTRGLALATPASLGCEAAEEIARLDVDAGVVVAFGQILPAPVLEAPRLGSFNLHASLLPRWRGAAPIQRAIMAGDPITGVQVMRMTAGLDEGPVLASHAARVDRLETAGSLHDRLALAGAALMVEALARVAAGEATPAAQSETGVSYARKIRTAETRLRWDRPAERIDRQIRGLSPHPGAWFLAPTERGPVRVKALLSCVEAAAEAIPAGVAAGPGLVVGCGEGAVRILRAQREGRAPREIGEFLRGFPIPPGARL